jgi:sporulation protein YlmC with PRC-barrel domain
MNLRQLKKLPVYTKLGIKLGKVIDINFLIETQSVSQYIVRPNFFGRILLINANQVLGINDEKIIVEDTVVPEGDKIKSKFISEKILGKAATIETDSK